MASNRPRDPSEDPDEALLRPSSLTEAADPSLRSVAERGDPARKALRSAATDRSSSPRDRVAAAVLLAALFQDTSALERLDPEDAAAPDSLGLRFNPQLRPSAARALGSAITMHLLTWATAERPGEPPVAAAEAADRLGIDDDGQIYRRVSQRAVLVDQQRGTGRAQKDQLRRLSAALGRADQQARLARGAAGEASPSAGPSQGGSPSDTPGPAVSGTPEPPTAQSPGPGSPGQAGRSVPDAPTGPEAHPGPRSWTAADDDALAAILGREQAPSPGRDTASDAEPSEPSKPAEPSDRSTRDAPAVEGEILEGRGADDPRQDGPAAPDAADTSKASEAPQTEQTAPGAADDQRGTDQPSSTHRDPDFGRPVGFDSPRSSHATPPPEDQHPAGSPGTGPSPPHGAEGGRPRSYEFRHLGEGLRTPMTEQQKTEQKTTLRNWGIFAIVLVVAILILAILL